MNLGIKNILFLSSILPIEFVNAEEECIGHICIPDSYDKTKLPLQNETNYVKVDFKGIRILKVDDEDFTITLSFLLYMQWIDARLDVVNHSEDHSYKNRIYPVVSFNTS